MWYWVASEAKTRQFKAEPVESFPEPSDPDKLAWMPMQKKKPNRIAGLLAFFPR